MRTTVTIDRDVERLLRDEMHRSKRSFKETLNTTVRAALSKRPARSAQAPFAIMARPLRLRAGIDPTSFNRLADDLEADAVAAAPRRRKRA